MYSSNKRKYVLYAVNIIVARSTQIYQHWFHFFSLACVCVCVCQITGLILWKLSNLSITNDQRLIGSENVASQLKFYLLIKMYL